MDTNLLLGDWFGQSPGLQLEWNEKFSSARKKRSEKKKGLT